ncbi:MAG: MBL fold metallo-hydrolase [bacterium]
MYFRCVTLASGSAGNSTYIENENTKILVDCGISGLKAKNALDLIGVNPSMIDAIFITHEHTDHISGVGVLSRRFKIPIYALGETWTAMQKKEKIGRIAPNNKFIIHPNEKVFINDLCVVPFSVCHDAIAPVCYNIYSGDKKISILTDVGYIDENIVNNIKNCNLLLIESNYNKEMLLNSSYPEFLKKRVLGKFGHISNETCGKLISHVFSERLKNVVLIHISKENNTKDLAVSTVSAILNNQGIKLGNHLNIHVAEEYGVKSVKV